MQYNDMIEIRDTRCKEKYQLDDVYLNGYARLCGVYATCVYNSLCRHVDKRQSCFPSVDLIAEQHNINRKTVLKAIRVLEFWGIIKIFKEKDEITKRQKNNIYILRDKRFWKSKPSPSGTPGAESVSRPKPSPFHDQSRVLPEDHKDTHIKDTHIREEDVNVQRNKAELKRLKRSLKEKKILR